MLRRVALMMPLLAVALLLATDAGQSRAAAGRAFHIHPCGRHGSVLCGTLRVPLYRGLPHGGGSPLTVHFRVYPHTDRSRPPLGPVLGAEGGPGYGSIDSASTYLQLMGVLHRRRDLIVVDNRGTGRSDVIDCRPLQTSTGGHYVRNVGRCARQLGPAASAYGTGAAADDIAAILNHLGVARVSVYGDSYGTYVAQALAVRHPARVRAMVLDGAFAVDGFDPWEREESATLRRAWTAVCSRSPGCDGSMLGTIRDLAARLDETPLVGSSRDADGARYRVRIDGAALAQMVVDGSFSYSIFRDLRAAAAAYDAGHPAPLLRLGAEDLINFAAGPARYTSEGDYAAVACHDYPTIWNPAADLATRRAQLAHAQSQLPQDVFAPFALSDWLRSSYEYQLVSGCLEWPAPDPPDPVVPEGAAYTHLPVLVINGDLDMVTPMPDARRAARLWPDSVLVDVHNVGHVTALYDSNRCASVIVRRFLDTLRTGDTGCARDTEEIHVVPAFPRSLASAPQAQGAGSRDRSTASDRRAAWAAAMTVGDALARWNLMYGRHGHGLRGGRFTSYGAYGTTTPLTLRMSALRFVRDLPVSGTAVWNRRALMLTATVTVPGGHLRIAWPTHVQDSQATIAGRLHGRTVWLAMPAP